MARIRIGELLISNGAIDAMQLESALAHQRQWGGRIGQAIVRLGFLTEERLLEAVGTQIGAPLVVIGDRVIPPQIIALVPAKLLRTRRAIPLEKLTEHRRGPLVVAFADPSDLGSVDEVAFATGLAIRAVLAAECDVEQAIERHLGGGPATRRAPMDLPPDTSALPNPSRKGFFQ